MIIVGLVAVPPVVRGLGSDRFGILSFAWAVLSYFTVFDLGLGRATTKYVAEAIGSGRVDTIPQVVCTATAVELIFGVVGGLCLVLFVPFLNRNILRLAPSLTREATATFYVLAPMIPIALLSASLSGVLEARQRFDLLNAVRIPTSASSYLLPWIGLVLGLGLPGVMGLVLIARAVGLVVLALLCVRLVAGLRKPSVSLAMFSRLFSFGGWLMVTGVVGPILTNLDRILVGSMVSVAAVGYYSAPSEVVARLGIASQSLCTSLFPAFSTLDGARERDKLVALFARALKLVLLFVGPLALALVLFAPEILRLWLGPEFAFHSASVTQILAVGALVNSVALVPYALLQGIGRPDLTAKFHVLELPVYVVLAWLLTWRFALAGAAVAWTLRMVLDAALLLAASLRLCGVPARRLLEQRLPATVSGIAALTVLSWALKGFAAGFPALVQSVLFSLLGGLFVCAVWVFLLDDVDRRAMVEIWNHGKGIGHGRDD